MLESDEVFPFDERDDPAELLPALPEIRHNLGFAPRDEELGLRSLLEWKEPTAPAWAYHAA